MFRAFPAALMTTTTYYDSDIARKPLLTEMRNLYEYRGLIRLLVTRDITVRYKRSSLGVWWTLLNPLFTSAALWIVFGQFFRFETGDTPYIVYLLSGILIATFFSQAVVATGASIVNSSSVLTKVYVPPEIFAFSASLAGAVNFLIGLIPLFIVQLVTGAGIPWTALLIPIPVIFLLALVAGVGLLVASAAVFFYDVLDFTGVLIQLIGYLTPTFYPISIIPEQFVPLIQANPLYSFLLVFRGFAYEGRFAPGWAFAVMIGTSIAVLLLGVWVFHRSWRQLVVVL
jgi:ABC-type polysaccharide/polyol phosphate export permease